MKINLPRLSTIKIVWIAASLLLLAMTITPAVASTPKPLKVSYGLYAGGFNVVDIQGTYTITNNTYDLNMDLKTVGMLGSLAPWGGVLNSNGHNKGAQSSPLNHSFKSIWRGKPETSTFTFNKDGSLKSYILVEDDGTVKDKMPDADVLTDNPIDMMSALYLAMNGANGCATTERVMDGKRSFDMAFRSKGQDKISANKYTVFDGNAEICEVEIIPVAGKWREKPRGWMSIQGQAKENGQLPRLWFGRVRDDMPPIPVRFFIKTNYGAMVMHLKSVD